jgi:ABC-2 type transport system ATP-binding protein
MMGRHDGPDVDLASVHKSYGSVTALDGIDLSIERGESVAILGPNGAGKTTAISLMLGLRRPTSGRVRIFGLEPGSRAARSGRGAMLQDSGIPTSLTVRELVDLFRRYYPAPMPTDAALEAAGLATEARKRAGTLSGGQRQRLYFALAICGDPPVLFLDEPTVAMDVQSRNAFLDTISGYASAGRTVVLTTHFMEEADRVARRIVVIDHGRIIADAAPAEIKARAAGRRVRFRTSVGLDPSILSGLPVRALTIRDGEVRFLSDEPEPILAELFRRGLVIRDLEVGGADLEDAFLALTGGATQQELAA